MWEFLSTFCSYLLLMFIIVVVAAIGFTIGLLLRKRKNKKLAEEVPTPAIANESDNNV